MSGRPLTIVTAGSCAFASIRKPGGRAPVSRPSGARAGRPPLPPRRACVRRACGGSEDTWWSTVRRETTSRSAISEFAVPRRPGASTSSSRPVSACGVSPGSHVAGRGGRSHRCFAQTQGESTCEAGSPPSCSKSVSPARAERLRRRSLRGRGRPRRRIPGEVQAAAAPSHVASDLLRIRLGDQSGALSSTPAFHCQYASSPANQRCRFSRASSYTARASLEHACRDRPRATRPRRGPPRTWPRRWRCPPGRASSSASSSTSATPGSPRLARARPSAMSAVMRLIVLMTGRPGAPVRALFPRPSVRGRRASRRATSGCRRRPGRARRQRRRSRCQPFRRLELVHLAETGCEHAVRRRDARVQAVLERDVEASLQKLSTLLDPPGHDVRRADGVERERLDLGVLELHRQREPRFPQRTPSSLSRLSIRR